MITLRKTGILLASNNSGKLKELQEMLDDFGIKVYTPKMLNLNLIIEENGKTYYENAEFKAKGYFQATGIPTLADDSGLEVDCLKKQPGVYSAGYGGEHLTDDERNEYLLKQIKNVADYLRTARFVCVLAFIYDANQPIKFYEGYAEGKIIYRPRGKNGFGYDPIFEDLHLKKTFAELEPEEKNRVSHRAMALKKFIQDLRLF